MTSPIHTLQQLICHKKEKILLSLCEFSLLIEKPLPEKKGIDPHNLQLRSPPDQLNVSAEFSIEILFFKPQGLHVFFASHLFSPVTSWVLTYSSDPPRSIHQAFSA